MYATLTQTVTKYSMRVIVSQLACGNNEAANIFPEKSPRTDINMQKKLKHSNNKCCPLVNIETNNAKMPIINKIGLK